ncbi:MAG: Rieske 2Fe-2S domain-containing protein [Nitrospirae bacterium]|nr:Rieske 2Fe-2S domain-containing protein [Nitrospirota bacterium]
MLASSIHLYPKEVKEMQTRYFPAINSDDAPRKGVKKTTLTYTDNSGENEARIFLAVLPEGLTAFSAVCSHLGCLVDWDRGKELFLCPCHGGKYDIAGNVAGGPPPESLTRLPVEIREGKVFVGVTV